LHVDVAVILVPEIQAQCCPGRGVGTQCARLPTSVSLHHLLCCESPKDARERQRLSFASAKFIFKK
jgi:hypothetical protein